MSIRAFLHIIILSFFFIHIQAQAVLSKNFSWKIESITQSEALNRLSQVINVPIGYSSSFFKEDKLRSYNFQERSLKDILNEILDDDRLEVKTLNDQILISRRKSDPRLLSGYVRDKDTGEGLISALISTSDSKLNTVSNEFGYYQLRVPSTPSDVTIRYLGYKVLKEKILGTENLRHDFSLESNAFLEEIIIVPDSLHKSSSGEGLSMTTIDKDALVYGPGLGEVDYVRALEQHPGFALANDGLGGLQVRGGESGQNLLLMDGVPIYIPYHLLGLFSVYNAATVKTARIFKSSIPARYGGGLSSVLDIWTKEGNQYEYHAQASMNLTNANLMAEGPLPFLKGKSSFMIAARLAPSGYLYQPTFKRIYFQANQNRIISRFQDLNGKLSYQMDDRNKIFMSFFSGYDSFRSSESEEEEDGSESESDEGGELEFSWKNTTGSARWNHTISPSAFLSTTLTYSNYGYEFSRLNLFGTTDPNTNKLFFLDSRSTNQDFSLKTDLHINPSPRHFMRFGGRVAYRHFTPSLTYLEEERDENEENNLNSIVPMTEDKDPFITQELNLYSEDRITLGQKGQINLGLRGNLFINDGKYFIDIEPRISLSHDINNHSNLSLSANRTVQYLHLINNIALRLPNDQWIPSNNSLNPQSSWLMDALFTHRVAKQWEWNLGVYYKTMDHIYTYAANLDFDESLNGLEPEDYLTEGKGLSYGLETSLAYETQSTNAHLSYTYSQNTRTYIGHNEGNSFPFEYDYRHRVNLNMTQKIRQFHLGLNAHYFSPNPRIHLTSIQSEQGLTSFNPDIGQKNQIRSQPYFRLDLSLRYEVTKKYGSHSLKLGIYNVTNRKNVAFYKVDFNDSQLTQSTPIHALTLLPTLSYTFRY